MWWSCWFVSSSVAIDDCTHVHESWSAIQCKEIHLEKWRNSLFTSPINQFKCIRLVLIYILNKSLIIHSNERLQYKILLAFLSIFVYLMVSLLFKRMYLKFFKPMIFANHLLYGSNSIFRTVSNVIIDLKLLVSCHLDVINSIWILFFWRLLQLLFSSVCIGNVISYVEMKWTSQNKFEARFKNWFTFKLIQNTIRELKCANKRSFCHHSKSGSCQQIGS